MVVLGASNTAVGRCEIRIGNDPYLKDLKKIADCTTNVKKDQFASTCIYYSIIECSDSLQNELDELLEVDMDEKREAAEQFGQMLHGLDRIIKAKTRYLNDLDKTCTEPLRKKISQAGNDFHSRPDDKSKKSKKKGGGKNKRKRKGDNDDDDNDQNDRPVTVVDLDMEHLVQDFYSEMDNVNIRRRIKREKQDENEETKKKKQQKTKRKRQTGDEEMDESEIQVQEQDNLESRLQTNGLQNNLMIDAPVLQIQDVANDFGEDDFGGQTFADIIMGMNVEPNDEEARLRSSVEQLRDEDNMMPFLSGLGHTGPGPHVTSDTVVSLNQEQNHLDIGISDMAIGTDNNNAASIKPLEGPVGALQELNDLNKTTDNTTNRVDNLPNDPFDLNFTIDENPIDNIQPILDQVTPVRLKQTENPQNLEQVIDDNTKRGERQEDSFRLESLHDSEKLKKKRREKPRVVIMDSQTKYSKEEIERQAQNAPVPQIVTPDVREKLLQALKQKEERKGLVQNLNCSSLRIGRRHGISLTSFLQDIHNPDVFVPTIFDFSQSQDQSQRARRNIRVPEEPDTSHNVQPEPELNLELPVQPEPELNLELPVQPEPELNLELPVQPAENKDELRRSGTLRRSKRSKLSNVIDDQHVHPTPVLPQADEELGGSFMPDFPAPNMLDNLDIPLDLSPSRQQAATTFFLCSPLRGLPTGSSSPLFNFGSTSPRLKIPSLPVSPTQGMRLPSMYGSPGFNLSQSLPSSTQLVPQWFKNINQGNDKEVPDSQNLFDRFPRVKELRALVDSAYFHTIFPPSDTVKGIALLGFEFMLILHDKEDLRIQQENSYGRIRITPLNMRMDF